MYSSSKYFEDLFLKYKSDKEFVNKYISALNAKFNKCKIVTELDYQYCKKTHYINYAFENESFPMELLDTEIDSICNYIIYDLNQYIGEELGHTLIYDDLIQKNEVFYSDAISKLVVGNSVKVNLSESIDNLHKDKILYGNKYFLIDNFKISIRVNECSLIYKNETDTLHVLLFKYNISFSEDLNDKIYILKMS